MAKYNITEYKESTSTYQDFISPAVLDIMQTKVLEVLLIQKKYRLKGYTAQMLAQELHSNTRYISAVCNVRFHMNYTTLVNKYRVEESMSILVDRRYLKLTMEDVADMVGFANRQSFYAAFYKQKGCTPREYKMNYLKLHPELQQEPKRPTKKSKDKK